MRIAPEVFLQRALFPKDEEAKEFHFDTFIFFQRVLTEIAEAKEQAKKYVAKSREAQFDKYAEENLSLLRQTNIQIEQMQKDIRIFVEDCERTVFGVENYSLGGRTTPQSRDFFYEFLSLHMCDPFFKVHGIEHDNPKFSTIKRNVVDENQHDTSTSMADQYHNVTGFYPGEYFPGNETLDNLQVFLNRLTNAGSGIHTSFHLTQVNLDLANPYIVNF